MKAKLIKSNSGRFYLEQDGVLIDNAHLCIESCHELFMEYSENYVDIETEFHFNGIGYTEMPKLDDQGNFILKKI